MGSPDSPPGSPRSKPHRSLRAIYTSPSDGVFTYTRVLKLAKNSTPQDRITHLSALKQAVTHMQERLNLELTRRIDSEKGLENRVDLEDGRDDTDCHEDDYDQHEDEIMSRVNNQNTLHSTIQDEHNISGAKKNGDPVKNSA